MKPEPRIVVVGAGVGGLAAAACLAGRGHDVTVVEAADAPGGKMREIKVDGRPIDVGPTVLTMRWALERVFADAGATLGDHLRLTRASTLARHAWSGGARLDLHADLDASADAIGAFAGPREARGYRAFSERARRVYETLRDTFIAAPRPNPLSLAVRIGPTRVSALFGISPFTTLWRALGDHFADPRLLQLFGRYSTYCGSSPFRAPATLMLVAHVERDGVWYVEGGMHRVADALQSAAEARGARFRFGASVARILVDRGRAAGVALDSGERLAADAVVFAGDGAALAGGLLGDEMRRAAPGAEGAERSLSATTFALLARSRDFPLVRHNVFFSDDYAAEFDDILARRRLPVDPTVYLCAQDRKDAAIAPEGPERVFLLVNAPTTARSPLSETEIETCLRSIIARLTRCGLALESASVPIAATPQDFATQFPGSAGAIYGAASHGWAASFRRPGARTRLPGLYLAGGTTHPGPGVPMAALSGRQAALAVTADLASTRRFLKAATPGGTSTRSPTTARTA